MKVSGAHVVFHKLVRTGKDDKCEKNAIQAVLLCKRTQDAPIHPGYWSLFGGKVDDNENPKDTVIREVKEELQANGQPLKLRKQKMRLLDNVKIRRKEGIRSIRYFSSLLDVDMDELQLIRNKNENKVEGEGLGWFTAEEVHHLMMRPEDRIAVTTFFLENGT